MKYVALVPFGYYLVTRLNTLREFLYVVATQWIPGVWLIHRLGDVDLLAALGLYAIGYLAFISIYEIGYFVNDTWDARRRPNARHRFTYDVGVAYVILFTIIRLAAWTAISLLADLIFMPEWIIGYIVLVITVALYNTSISDTARSALFVQMTYLRYILPIFIFAGPENLLLLIFISTIMYNYFRFLSFLDGKGFLAMPEKKRELFGILQTIMFFPLVMLATLATNERVILEVYMIYLAIYGAYYVKSVAS